MGVAKNEATLQNQAIVTLGSQSSRWVKRLKTSSNLKSSYSRAFLSYTQRSESMSKRPRGDQRATLQNASATAAAVYDSWIRRWRHCQPLPRVTEDIDGNLQVKLGSVSVGAMALMGRSSGFSQCIRFRKSTSLVAWA